MEQRTNSPYPRLDRPVVAILGAILVLSTVLFWWADRTHDWRYYQYAFRQQVGEKLGAGKVGTVPSGLQQIWVAELGRADRCTTCHQAVTWKGFEKADEPLRTHPVEPELLRPRRQRLEPRDHARHGRCGRVPVSETRSWPERDRHRTRSRKARRPFQCPAPVGAS